MNVKELVKECEGKLKVGDTPIIKFLRLTWYSFRGDFERIRGDISFNELGKSEIERFIKVCDNRINRAGILLNEIATVLGFDLTALSIIAVISSGVLEKSDDPVLSVIVEGQYSIQFRILVIFLFVALIFLITLLGHYRTHVHAWTAFKEEAILNEKCESK
jgi:hypothetical protein